MNLIPKWLTELFKKTESNYDSEAKMEELLNNTIINDPYGTTLEPPKSGLPSERLEIFLKDIKNYFILQEEFSKNFLDGLRLPHPVEGEDDITIPQTDTNGEPFERQLVRFSYYWQKLYEGLDNYYKTVINKEEIHSYLDSITLETKCGDILKPSSKEQYPNPIDRIDEYGGRVFKVFGDMCEKQNEFLSDFKELIEKYS